MSADPRTAVAVTTTSGTVLFGRVMRVDGRALTFMATGQYAAGDVVDLRLEVAGTDVTEHRRARVEACRFRGGAQGSVVKVKLDRAWVPARASLEARLWDKAIQSERRPSGGRKLKANREGSRIELRWLEPVALAWELEHGLMDGQLQLRGPRLRSRVSVALVTPCKKRLITTGSVLRRRERWTALELVMSARLRMGLRAAARRDAVSAA